MKFERVLLILSLLAILLLTIIIQNKEFLEEGTIREISYNSDWIKINLEENKTISIFTQKIINLKEGDSIEFKKNNGFSPNKGEILVDQIWKISP